ncbi:serine hydrolase domain-containing protein [Paenibacillus tepidiphilus]|uniref:serine hydrolase domain-containing protein n=1 Tax=Paenibacillus tepidiphilus TaxID=2608683 RepID=UPI00123BA3D0|nr:serine hydrolase domain-containing protein [Paenibacillus tepidiphilus]
MDKLQAELKQYMRAWAEEGRFSGSVMVAQGESVLLHEGYGYANLEFCIPNTASTKYNIASVTKMFTAVAVMQLHEQGNLDLEDSLAEYVPEYIHAGAVTLHHLLASLSGIPEYTELPEYNVRIPLAVTEILAWLNRYPLQAEPGTQVDKSNSNYILLAMVVERVSGMPLEEYFKCMLFEPLGLTSTGVCYNEDVIPGKACGYSYSGEGAVRAEYYEQTGAYGSGYLYSSAEDLLKWVRALENGVIITADSYRKMTTPYGYLWYMEASSGYGCFVKNNPADEMFMDGNIYGYTCTVRSHSCRNTVFIVLGNNDAIAISRLVQGLQAMVFAQPVSGPIRPQTIETADCERYRHLTGKYVFPPMDWSFTISLEDGRLQVDRLFIQRARREKFRLGLVAEAEDSVTFACEVCDSTYVFRKNTADHDFQADYLFDALKLTYVRTI